MNVFIFKLKSKKLRNLPSQLMLNQFFFLFTWTTFFGGITLLDECCICLYCKLELYSVILILWLISLHSLLVYTSQFCLSLCVTVFIQYIDSLFSCIQFSSIEFRKNKFLYLSTYLCRCGRHYNSNVCFVKKQNKKTLTITHKQITHCQHVT